MVYELSDGARMASAAALLLMAILLLIRHILLPRLSASQLRRFEVPVVLLAGVFVTYVIANFLSVRP
jgi:hypothetical protein